MFLSSCQNADIGEFFENQKKKNNKNIKCFKLWDWDLAETAEYNVRSCVFAHDQCRSTTKFPMAGQNIYMAKTSRLNVTVQGFMTEAIFLWFEEQFDADHEVLLSYHKTV